LCSDGEILSKHSKLAVVTGGASGIGRATAIELEQRGYAVVSIDVTEPALAQLDAEDRQAAREIRHYRADVGDTAALEAVYSTEMASGLPLAAIVSCAAVAWTYSPATITDAEWDRVHDINLRGAFRTFQFGAEWMARSGGGSMVALSSGAAFSGWKDHIQYSSTKAAILGMVRGLAKEYGPSAIRANSVLPGLIRTAQSLSKDSFGEEGLEAYRPNIPLQRIGMPEEVAKLIAFLCSDDASYITGAAISIDGGIGGGFH
jgi:NAD(P)-dependent dehydrogenase (short-subunit alcohol dehydrogenase family)